MIYQGYLETPIGVIEILSDNDTLTSVYFIEEKNKEEILNDLIIETKKELNEYFLGTRKTFSYQQIPNGTKFQMAVWRAVQSVPFGQTESYADIAEKINNPRAVRAVGTAIGSNPLALIIPCQRVINKSGDIGGYGMEVWRKKYLLELENAKKFIKIKN